jgi:hypothetical protein
VPTASLRSLLLICIFRAAFACLASMQMTGRPILFNSVHSQVDVAPASSPIRATCAFWRCPSHVRYHPNTGAKADTPVLRICARRRRSASQDADATAVRNAIHGAVQAFTTWRLVPAPRRGELARVLGQELRAAKDELGRLVTIEVGKIASDLALQFRTA